MGKYTDMLGEGYDIITSFFKKPKPKPKKKDAPFRDEPKGDSNWAKRRKKLKEQLAEIDDTTNTIKGK